MSDPIVPESADVQRRLRHVTTEAPIGIFDSGVGGLTVARAILDQLPHEPIIYLGDTAHVPYGQKPIAEVRRYALACTDQLVDRGVKLLVIACNSAAAACLHDARERYNIPVVEVIRPAVRRAAAATRTGRIGVIGTALTINSKAYVDAFAAAPHINLTTAACPQFVDFVERGITSGRALLGLASAYLEPLQRAEVDTLVLGCTHYPLLAGVIGLVMGDGVTLVSSADETAKEVYRILVEQDLLRPDPSSEWRTESVEHQFLVTGDPAPFNRLIRRFIGPGAVAVTAGAALCD
ncbi:MAG: glutamate racemase [Micromonosporaceae bacterium]|nr:glutamate racemase [Micromonosporaceae bacterium]